jgi:hypothetical protein
MIKSKLSSLILLIGIALLSGCEENDDTSAIPPDSGSEIPDTKLTDEELLDLVQHETFKYFWDYADQNSGAALERYHPGNPSFSAPVVATGGTGFGLMAMLVAIERNFVNRAEAVQRIEKILSFLESAERFHGAWPHWINGNTGKVIPFSSLDDGGDLVETAFLCQGLLSVSEYFRDGNLEEKELAEKARELWMGVEWDWYTQGEDALYWHWSPNHGFEINFKLEGYNEVLITYVLAAASPTHSISKNIYDSGWAANGNIQYDGTAYGYPLLLRHRGDVELGGPLFWSHYSYLGLNPNGLSDAYANYEEVNKNHATINYAYCQENPKKFAGYGDGFWGLTASYSRNADGSLGYTAHSPGNDLGIISPTAALSSMPYTPVQSMKALRSFYDNREKLLGPAGFYDAFSSDLNWVAEAYLAIDQGPQIIMIENYRSGLLWNLFMRNEEVRAGLDKLGFSYQN